MMKRKRANKAPEAPAKKVITCGSAPDEITDLFADALVQFIMAVEQETKEEKESA